MKAIYINIDPYLAAFAAWLKGGKVGTAPSFDPLPLAVTVPLGESAAIYIEKAWIAEDEDFGPDMLTIDGQTVGVSASFSASEEIVARDVVPGLSSVAPGAKYAVASVSGDMTVRVGITDGEADVGGLSIPVLVRRETASGPVDLVDFTPPAAAIAAGTDLKGTKFNGNEIVAAAGTGALSAPAGA